jgi:ribonuclease D
MVTLALPAPQWIDTPASLDDLVRELGRHKRLAVDTESNSLHAYRERVCLIQISTTATDYLIDPLALDDLSPLGPLFSDPAREKVFHAAEYDLICLRRDYGFELANLFDTMQAARILGYTQVGLDSMLKEKSGITLNKKYQKADWGLRPLSQEMLNYARLDTHHLLELRDCLAAELDCRQLRPLADEEFVRLARGNGSHKAEVPAWQRVSGSSKLNGPQLAILQELCNWREDRAARIDRPTFKVLDDRHLVALAEDPPTSFEDLDRLHFTPRQVTLYGRQLLEAVARGARRAPPVRPRHTRPPEVYLRRLDLLSEWRKTVAQKNKLESDIVLPKAWMQAIAEKEPRSLQELALLMPESPWRLEHYGPMILQELAKVEGKKKSGDKR